MQVYGCPGSGHLGLECWVEVRAGSGDLGIIQQKEIEKLSAEWLKS